MQFLKLVMALEHANRKTSVDGGSANVQSGQKLTVGSCGLEVEEFQKQLNAWRATKGLSLIAVDGNFGKESTEAIKQFQLATGISSDGIAGPNTKTQLKKELSSIT